MRFAPAGLPWLVWWDVRIRYRTLSMGRIKLPAVLIYGSLLIAAHALAGVLLWGLFHARNPMSAEAALKFSTGMLAFLLFFIVIGALFGAFRTIFAGRELSLLLSSPMPFARILWMRVLSLVIGAWMPSILLVAPVANMGTILGRPKFLLIYPVTIGLAVCAVAATLALVAAALRVFGVRRARKLMQLAQAVLPAGFFLLTLLGRSSASKTPANAAPGMFGQFDIFAGLLQLPARAIRGDADALLIFALIAAGALWLAVQTARSALLTALQAPDAAPVRRSVADARQPSKPLRFSGSLFKLLLKKEWRTILRDPRLAGSLLVQPLFVLPFFYLNLMHGHFKLGGAAAAATFVAAQMSQYIANLMISAEEAPGLLGAAPVSRSQLIRYKCLAALLPVGVLMLLPALYLAAQDLWTGLVCLVCALGAAFCACAIEVARPYPSPRRSFVQMRAARRQRDPLDIFSILLLQLGWTAGAWFLADRNVWGALIVFGAILVPFFEWWRDANRQSLLGY